MTLDLEHLDAWAHSVGPTAERLLAELREAKNSVTEAEDVQNILTHRLAEARKNTERLERAIRNYLQERDSIVTDITMIKARRRELREVL